MTGIMSPEYEMTRSLVFFGFMCGLTFAALIVVLVQMFMGWYKDDKDKRE